jgi:tryptophan-rich sensory protein
VNKLLKLILSIILCEGVGILGSIFTIPSITSWYLHLNKPTFNPPNWIFGPVWTVLYLLIGISLYLILEKKLKKEKSTILLVFSLQLFLNFLWSIIFFGMHLPLAAFVGIAFLWGSIIWLIINFWKFSKAASLILVPYLCWVSFAAILNLTVAILNP